MFCGSRKVGSVDKLPPPSLPGILWRTMALASLADPHSPSELGPHAELEGEIPVQPNHHSRKGTPKSQSQRPSVSSYLLSSTILFFFNRNMLFGLCKNIWSCTSWVFQARKMKREKIPNKLCRMWEGYWRCVCLGWGWGESSCALGMLWTKL